MRSIVATILVWLWLFANVVFNIALSMLVAFVLATIVQLLFPVMVANFMLAVFPGAPLTFPELTAIITFLSTFLKTIVRVEKNDG